MKKTTVLFVFAFGFTCASFAQRSPAGCVETKVKVTEKTYKEGSVSGGGNAGVAKGEVTGKGGTETTREYTVKEKVCNDRIVEPKEKPAKEPKEKPAKEPREKPTKN